MVSLYLQMKKIFFFFMHRHTESGRICCPSEQNHFVVVAVVVEKISSALAWHITLPCASYETASLSIPSARVPHKFETKHKEKNITLPCAPYEISKAPQFICLPPQNSGVPTAPPPPPRKTNHALFETKVPTKSPFSCASLL